MAEHPRHRLGEDVTQPVKGLAHVRLRQHVARGYEHVQPHLSSGRDQDGATAAAAPHQFEPCGVEALCVEISGRLRAADDDCGGEGDADTDEALSARVGYFAVKDRGRRAPLEDGPGPTMTGKVACAQRPTARSSTGST